ncbi:GNAT family N-acetyltransferase [Longispora sp. NPDC051575]|uniref:GNAT family N-acetyltransferase n=1 Tax=Longispora sp. NPDC051575 TaxID=3154943 RepID=UPI00342C094E
MTTLLRTVVARDDAADLLDALAAWTPVGTLADGLHLGDVGWFLRFDAEECAGRLLLWTAVTDGVREPVAAGFLDGPVLRLALRPDAAPARRAPASAGMEVDGPPADPELVGAPDAAGLDRAPADSGLVDALADDIGLLLGDAEAWCDAADGTALRAALVSRGWLDERDAPWPLLVHPLSPAPPRPAGARPVAEADAADRVAVQRAAFEGSTFTVERWRLMKDSVAGPFAVEALVRTPDGEAAAAATGWFAGAGRCAILEPVGAHPDHRGQGYGRAAVHAVCAALAERGASAVAVATPGDNRAAVALYLSAGFVHQRDLHDLYRPAP